MNLKLSNLFTDKRIKNTLVIIVLLATFLRIVIALGYWRKQPLARDGEEYIILATNLAEGKGYNYGEEEGFTDREHHRRPPLYPFFIAFFFIIFGENLILIRLLNCVIGGINVILFYLLGKKCLGKKAGLFAAIISAFYPLFIWLSVRILSETLFMSLVLSSILLLYRAKEHPGLAPSIFTGITLAAAALCRPALLTFVPLAPIFLLTNKGEIKKGIKKGALLIIAFIITLAPWIARNYIAYNRFVIITAEGGITFWTGNHPEAVGEGDMGVNPEIKIDYVNFRERYKHLTYEEMEPIYYRRALSYILSHKMWFIALLFKKLFYFFIPIGRSILNASPAHRLISWGSYFPLFALAIFGMIRTRKRWLPLFPIYLLVISSALTCMLYFPQERYRIPTADLVFIILAGYSLFLFFSKDLSN
jgi:4-amino-4-deoxy-L-arabinose transferase-like glycosyltransferase